MHPSGEAYEANTSIKSGHVIGDGGSFDVSVDYAYNASFGELVSREATVGAAPAPAFSSAYTYDVQGRISSLTETNDGQTSERSFTYNNRGWLTEVRDGIGDLIAAYSFDDNGNRLTGPGIALGDAVYDDHDQLLTYGNTSFTYDENGYVIEKSTPPQTTSYVYDDLGSLSEVITPTGEQIRYIYDAADRRIAKIKEGVFVEGYIYGPTGRPTAVVDDQGRLIQRFIYAEGLCPTAMETTGGMQYAIVSDHLCSIRQIINLADGSVVQAMDYDEYGNVLRDTNPGFTPFGYAGGIYDPDTALVHFGAREYDPSVGRFLQRDPAGSPGRGNSTSSNPSGRSTRLGKLLETHGGVGGSHFAATACMGRRLCQVTLIFLSSCVSTPEFYEDDCHQCDLWGHDGRQEAHQLQGPHLIEASRATAALFIGELAENIVGVRDFERAYPAVYTLRGDLEEQFEGHGPCSELRFVDQASRKSTCGAVLITPTVMATAAHCLEPNNFALNTIEEVCARTTVLFDYEASTFNDSGPSMANVDDSDIYRCQTVNFHHLIDDEGLPLTDLALFVLDRAVEGRAPIRPNLDTPLPGTEVTSLGFPNGLPMKFASGEVRSRLLTDKFIAWLERHAPEDLPYALEHEAKRHEYFPLSIAILRGSSGGPVFETSTGALVGISTHASAKSLIVNDAGWDFMTSNYYLDTSRTPQCVAEFDCSRADTVCQTYPSAMPFGLLAE